MRTVRLLLIQDEPEGRLARGLLTGAWSGVAFRLARAPTLEGGLTELAAGSFDAAALDLELPDCRGLAALLLVRRARPDLPVVVLAGRAEEALALEALRLGAQDYVVRERADAPTVGRCVLFAVERSAAAAGRAASVT